jgi:signal peptidase II
VPVLARVALAITIVGLLVYLDLGTKSWAAHGLRARGPRTVAAGLIRLHYQENPGITVGILREGAPYSSIVGYAGIVCAALTALLVYRVLSSERLLLSAGLAVLVGGSLGNLHDRLEHSYVVDFIDFQGRLGGIFNLADVALAIGIGLCAAGLAQLAMRDRQRRRPPALV